jgi:hypothetical protein
VSPTVAAVNNAQAFLLQKRQEARGEPTVGCSAQLYALLRKRDHASFGYNEPHHHHFDEPSDATNSGCRGPRIGALQIRRYRVRSGGHR